MTKLKEELDEVDKPKPIVLKHEMYPKYDPVIGQNNRKYLSYDLELFGLENLQTFSSRLESTTQVFVYGHDIFFARTSLTWASTCSMKISISTLCLRLSLL